jgi:hypothetical protein
LFEYACRITRAGIRHQLPHATEDEIAAELRRRLRIQRQLESK